MPSGEPWRYDTFGLTGRAWHSTNDTQNPINGLMPLARPLW